MEPRTYRTISPEEAEMMLVIRRLEKELAAERRYPTAEEIAKAMDETTVEQIRTLVSSVNSGNHKYVYTVRLKTKRPPGQPKKRGAPPATYYLAQMFMIRYPRTGFFLSSAAEFKKDENTAVNEKEFREHMLKEPGFTTELLNDDFDWCSKKHYISRYPPKKPTTFQPNGRIYAEMQWIEVLASEYLKQQRNETGVPVITQPV